MGTAFVVLPQVSFLHHAGSLSSPPLTQLIGSEVCSWTPPGREHAGGPVVQLCGCLRAAARGVLSHRSRFNLSRCRERMGSSTAGSSTASTFELHAAGEEGEKPTQKEVLKKPFGIRRLAGQGLPSAAGCWPCPLAAPVLAWHCLPLPPPTPGSPFLTGQSVPGSQRRR